jgi:hypothetical protein
VNELQVASEMVSKFGFAETVAIMVLALFGIIVVAIIKFLHNIVEIRRQIVEQVTESRKELVAISWDIRGLRSDTRELYRAINGMWAGTQYQPRFSRMKKDTGIDDRDDSHITSE